MPDLRPDQIQDLAYFIQNPKALHLSEPGCVDADTEFLTPTGWVRFGDYDPVLHTTVAQYLPEHGMIEFVQPEAFVKLACEDMLHFKTKYGIDQMLSREHRMLLTSLVSDQTETVSADEVARRALCVEANIDEGLGRSGNRSRSTISYRRAACPTAFDYVGSSGLGLSEAQLRVQIAVIADGHFKRQTNWCTVSIKKARKVERLRNLLREADIEFDEIITDYESARGFHRFRFFAPWRVKEFDVRFWDASARDLEVIRDEVLHWDGDCEKSFFTNSRPSADFVQFAFVSGGHSARVMTQVRGESIEYVVQIRHDVRRIGFSGFKEGGGRAANVELVASPDGFKYCFQVPSTYLVFRRNGCVFASGNTGKTPTVCVAQAYRWREHGVGSVWAMPKALMSKNYDEAMRFGGWSEGDVVIVDGSPKKVRAALTSGAKVFIMGFTRFGLSWQDLPDYVKAIDIDEFHKGFGGHEAKRTQALYNFMNQRGEFFIPMTGTLYNGKPDTVYPAIQIVEPRYYGTFEVFKRVHHVVDPWTGKTVGYRNLEALRDILLQHGVRRLWKEIHGEAEKIVHIERLDMSPEQRRLYDEFEQNAILELEQFFIDGTKPGVNFIRARQIMEHPNCFPDLRDPKLPPVDIMPGELPSKMEALDLHMTNAVENDKPLVVFASLVPQQRQIFEMMKSQADDVAWISGEDTKNRAAYDEAFRRGDIRYLVCSDQIADCGFNWQFCGQQEVDHCIFASLGYVDTTVEQAYKRFLRQARQSALRITVLAYRNSMDQHLMRGLKRKSEDANKVDPTREILPF